MSNRHAIKPDSIAISDINAVMADIVGSLVPVSCKDANPELWFIYDEMQQWALCARRALHQAKYDQSLKCAGLIIHHLDRLNDRKLAGEINRVIRLYTPNAKETLGS